MPSVQSVTKSRGGDKGESAPNMSPSRVTWVCADSADIPCHSSSEVSKGTSGGWNFLISTLFLPSVAVQRVPGHVCADATSQVLQLCLPISQL